jgi:hypothetical protein
LTTALGPKDVAEIVDLPENTVRQRLYQMSKDGEVKLVARGSYVPHNDTPAAITCLHGYPAGEGCYSCDPDHPYRLGGGAT